jgi:carbonic anhydrase/acetyltransferase-like protein (isoleucine patch superfamily)
MILGFAGKTPNIGERVFIAESADIIGDVTIGEDSSIWFGSILRGDISPICIGRRTNIQDGTVIHVARGSNDPMLIGNDVSIGHHSTIHACTIEDCCLIGMGSIILDGAVIAKNSIIGAGSLVTSKKVFPSRSLILGSPAVVVRPLTDEEVQSIHETGFRYVDLSKQYRIGS